MSCPLRRRTSRRCRGAEVSSAAVACFHCGEAAVIEAHVSFGSRRLRVRWSPERLRAMVIPEILERLGYHAHPAGSDEAERARKASARRELLRLGIAGLCAMQAMMFSEALYF